MWNCRWIPGLALLAVVTGACSDAQPMAPEGTARTEVFLRGDGDLQESSSAASNGMVRTASQGGVNGSIDVKAKVSIQTESGEWVALTNQAVTGTVSTSAAAGETLLAQAELGATSYSRVRVEFEEVRATLAGEVAVGVGLAGAELQVQTGGDGVVVVEREVRFTAESDVTTRLVIDLRAREWMDGQAGAEGVTEAAFSSAVVISASQS